MTTPPTFASAVKYRWFSLMYTIFPCTVPFLPSAETIPFDPSQLVGTQLYVSPVCMLNTSLR